MIRYPYFQQDDIPDGKPKKDCFCNFYRVYLGGKKIKQGKHAIKQTKKIEGRTILKRKWNESRKQWADEGWILKMVNGIECASAKTLRLTFCS